MSNWTGITEDFYPSQSTVKWLESEYPQIDIVKTTQAFIEWASNAIEKDKRNPNYGKPIHCANWNLKMRNVIRIAMTNKWTGIAIPKQGQEIDVRWAEVLSHAKAIGCPLQRMQHDTVESFRTRIKNWETYDRPSERVLNFGDYTKAVK